MGYVFMEGMKYGCLSKTVWYYAWLSCISKPRSAYDIAKEWNIDKANIIKYLPKAYTDKNLLRVVDFVNRTPVYQTIFDGYIPLLKRMYPDDKYVGAVSKNESVWINFWNNSSIFRRLCSLDIIRKEWVIKGERKPLEKGFLKIPLQITIYFLMSYMSLEYTLQKMIDSGNEESISGIKFLAQSFTKEILRDITYFIISNFFEVKKDVKTFHLKETFLWNLLNEESSKFDKILSKHISTLLEYLKKKPEEK